MLLLAREHVRRGLLRPDVDLHLPRLVVGCLAGERGGDDARMLEVLEPYRGQRFRVVRLLWAALFHARHLLPRLPR